MSLRSWIARTLRGESAVEEVQSGRPQDTGGEPDPSAPDAHSTTGTTPKGSFVGRAAGQDVGYLETGSERRAAAQESGRPEGGSS